MPTSKAISASSFFGKDRYEYYLNELLTEQSIGGQKLSKEQLKEGFSKRKNKISFEKFVDKLVTTKSAKAVVSSLGKGPSPASGGGMNGPRGNALVRSPSGALQKYTGVSQKVGGGIEEDISAIAKYMSSIADTLALQKKVDNDASAYDKRKAEQEKRKLAENKLEKRFEGLKKVAEKIIAPVKSLLDKILQFFTTVILGRIVYKLVEWLGDEKNASKVKSIIRFVKDWWPALLGSYILFGTSFGKLVRGLTGTVGRFIFQIGKVAIPQLLKVIAANPVTSLVVGGAAAAGIGAYAASQQNEQKREGVKPGQGTPGSTQLQREQVLQRGLGGMFNGGGFVNGFVSGEKGVDKVPAMLSDGEFVMSRGAVAKYGVDTLEAMNAAGGGTNKPKIMSGTTYAAGGGMVGSKLYSNNSFSGDPVQNIKNFIKHKLGYDVDKPSTWGQSFGSGMTRFDSSRIVNQIKGGSPVGLNIANQVYQSLNNSNLQKDVFNYGMRKIDQIKSSGSKILGDVKGKVFGVVDSPLAALEKYGTERENALIKSGELKPGAALTKTMQANLDKSDAWIKSLYDPKKDRGPIGKVKQIYQDIQNKGLTPDLTAMMGLKSEGFEKFVEKASGGRVKNFGAKLTGLQYAVKGLMGPLGKAFRIDDGGSLGRYVRPAILEAQRRGQGGVGAVGLGQKDYDKLMGDRIANLALGQFNFNVDKNGRATTNDTYEANKPASEYFKNARSNFKNGKIGPALFQAVSGVLRINQNTGWGNLRPGGAGIDLGGGFTPTDDKGKPIPPTKSKSPVTMYSSNDPRRKQSGPYQSRFARPKNAGVKSVKPPSKPSVIYKYPQSVNKNKPSSIYNRPSTSNVPNFSASTRGGRSKQNTLGLVR